MTNEAVPADGPLPAIDAEMERLVAALPLRAPSDRLDHRIAATAHFEARPRISRLRWPAAAAAILFVGAGLAIGWSLRGASESAWIPAGTQWQTAGIAAVGSRTLPDGRVVQPAGAVYIRTDRLYDPRTGATVEIQSIEPQILVVRPSAD
jgi:hypothetical protein